MLLHMGRRHDAMSAAHPLRAEEAPRLRELETTTLLDLVRAIGEVTDDEREIVAAVHHLLHSGRVRLCGNFRGASSDDLA
jgi:hypothetical protein